VMPIFPDAAALSRWSFVTLLRLLARRMSRKTGVRLSAPVALFILFILVGWFVSLSLVIGWQAQRIRRQQDEIRELTVWREQTLIELQALQERQRLMDQLGIRAGSGPGKGKP
jgi:Zn-dependent protease with chaperone function